MPRGVPELKNRYTNQRERRHNWARWQETFNRNQEKTSGIQHLYREDPETGEITRLNRSVFNREVGFFPQSFKINEKICCATPSSIIWTELERGAKYFGDKGIYWLETVLVAAKAA